VHCQLRSCPVEDDCRPSIRLQASRTVDSASTLADTPSIACSAAEKGFDGSTSPYTILPCTLAANAPLVVTTSIDALPAAMSVSKKIDTVYKPPPVFTPRRLEAFNAALLGGHGCLLGKSCVDDTDCFLGSILGVQNTSHCIASFVSVFLCCAT
jgi:hypothetical protein